jgi:ketosteroid isomerase-like protein
VDPNPEHPNIDLLRRYSAALQDGRAAEALTFFTDDLVLHVPGSSAHAGTYQGKEAVLEYYTRVFRDTDGHLEVLGIDDHLASDRHGASIVRWRLRRQDRVLDVHRIALYRIEDGRIAEIWVHDRDQAAYDAFFPPTVSDDPARSAPSAR